MTTPATVGRGAVQIRPAQPDDADSIHALLSPHVRAGIVLPRPAAEIRAHAARFLVAVGADAALLGCVAWRPYETGLLEIRSLAVAKAWAGQGIGTLLVTAALAAARQRGASEVFALTLRPRLFRRLGFVQVEKDRFPQKVWADCRHCAKRECCDEVALSLVFES